MNDYKMSKSELNFAEIIWSNEPLSSGELVKLCEEKFRWKKSTTYTVLKKLCEKEIFKNENAIVTSLVKKHEFQEIKSQKFIEDTFGGSLPKFLTAFMGRKKMSKKEIDELKNLIDTYGEE